jgi:hypothetical protein
LFGHRKASDFSSEFVSTNLFTSVPVSTSPETLNPGGKYNAKCDNGSSGRKRRGHGITGKIAR